MKPKKDSHTRIWLWPENRKRLKAIVGKSPNLLSVNKVANIVLAHNLCWYEKKGSALLGP